MTQPDRPTDDRLLFVDVESTGLDDHGPGGLYVGGQLLEVGLMLTDPDLRVVATCARTIRHSTEAVRHFQATAAPWVVTTHATPADDGGRDLWTECTVSAKARRVDEAEDDLLAFLADFDVHPGTLPMAGSSPHFDRAWLRVHMPRLARHFHYRNTDVSTVKELVRRWVPEHARKADAPVPASKHRVVPDLHDTVTELAHYRRLLAPQVAGQWARSA